MKKLIYITILLLSFSLKAQDIQWQKTLGGVHAEYVYDAIPTLDYGFIMVGGSLSNDTGDVGKNAGDFDYFITKVSEYGNLEWTTTIGGDKTDIIKSITNTQDGGYLVAGISNSKKGNDKEVSHIGGQDIWLLKINIEGQIEWQKTLGGLANENVQDVIKTTTGYLIAGTSASSDYISEDSELLNQENLILKNQKSRGNLDYWLIKLDLQGDLIWQKTYGGKYKDELKKVIELNDGSIVLAGNSNSPLGQDKRTLEKGLNDWWVLKLDQDGNTIWQKAFGEDGNDQLTSLLFTKDQHILLTGNFRNKKDHQNGESDFTVIKLDLDGEIVWKNTYNEATNDILTDVVQNQDQSYLLSGYVASEKQKKSTSKTQNSTSKKPERGTEDFMVIKIDKDGEELWRKNIGTDKKEVLRKCIKTRDGGYVLMGSSMPFKAKGNNDANFWIVKLLDKDKPKVSKLPLETIPNPTFAFTSVVIGEDYKDGKVTVVDMTGRVLQQFDILGNRIIPVNLEAYPDGVYIVNVQTNKQQNSVKIAKISH